MKIRQKIWSGVGLIFLSTQSSAYEIETHARISKEALAASRLTTDLSLIKNMAIDPKEKFPNSKGDKEGIPDLIRNGSRFEDGFSCSETRSRNHFFDPRSGSGLNWKTEVVGGLGTINVTGIPSPDWALEEKGTQTNQDYSWKSARNNFYVALTPRSNTERSQSFGMTFQILGQITHHIQDMAQPQHVRNDPHYASPPQCGPATYLGRLIKENPSRYEHYTDAVRDSLRYDTYLTVNQRNDAPLASARQFWIGDGRGIADFTNANFVSAGTNFIGAFQNGQLVAGPNRRYDLPVPSPQTPVFYDANLLLKSGRLAVPSGCLPTSQPCVMAFFSSKVMDNYRLQEDINLKASTASIFDQDLELHGTSVSYPNLDRCTDPRNPATCEQIETNQVFSLNRFNFDAAHQFLIPRAVAYSAGLIDYFFRGRLGAEDVEFTDPGVWLRVRNAISRSYA